MNSEEQVSLAAGLAVRAARAEMERDQALERLDKLKAQHRMLSEGHLALLSGDEKAIKRTLQIAGIPARDLADIYRVVGEWHRSGSRPTTLDLYRELAALRARVAELEGGAK